MKLPPLNALKAFEAVSRLGSVSRAAEELCVSQGAVSKQLRKLEDYLKLELFIRSPNRFKLSAEGEDYFHVIHRSLGDIADVTRSLKRQNLKRRLMISSSEGFSTGWLFPNLSGFKDLCPDVVVAVENDHELVSFKNYGFDAAIRFSNGGGKFNGLDSVLLFEPSLFAVASSEYLDKHGKLKSLNNPEKHILIDTYHKLKEARALQVKWTDIISHDGFDFSEQGEIYPGEFQAFNAAVHGRGIALASNYLIQEKLREGLVEYAYPKSVSVPYSCYFLTPSDARQNNDLVTFRDWLRVELNKL